MEIHSRLKSLFNRRTSLLSAFQSFFPFKDISTFTVHFHFVFFQPSPALSICSIFISNFLPVEILFSTFASLYRVELLISLFSLFPFKAFYNIFADEIDLIETVIKNELSELYNSVVYVRTVDVNYQNALKMAHTHWPDHRSSLSTARCTAQSLQRVFGLHARLRIWPPQQYNVIKRGQRSPEGRHRKLVIFLYMFEPSLKKIIKWWS